MVEAEVHTLEIEAEEHISNNKIQLIKILRMHKIQDRETKIKKM